MAFRRTPNPYNTLSPRNRLVAERERLHAEEQRLVKRIDDLRSRQDDLSNQLMRPNPSLSEVRDMMAEELAQRPVGSSDIAKFVLAAGDAARGRVPPPLPPKGKGSVARMVVLAGRKAKGERVDDEY
jgi:hypothetical protein